MDNRNLKDRLGESQTIFTSCYIFIIGIGMLFNHSKYSRFGINIFDYSDIFDFLLAPFSDVIILLFSIVSIIIMFVLVKYDKNWRIKNPESYSKYSFGLDKKKRFSIYLYTSQFLTFLSILYAASGFYGKYQKEQILSQKPITIHFVDKEVKEGILIGKTKDVIFLLRNEKVEAIPFTETIKNIEITKKLDIKKTKK